MVKVEDLKAREKSMKRKCLYADLRQGVSSSALLEIQQPMPRSHCGPVWGLNGSSPGSDKFTMGVLIRSDKNSASLFALSDIPLRGSKYTID